MRMELHEFAVTGHWYEEFCEPRFVRWTESLRAALKRPSVTLGLVFLSPAYFCQASQVLEILRVHGQVGLLAGCSSGRLIAGGEEIEERGGVVVGLYHLPGAELKAVHLVQTQVAEANGPAYWHAETGVLPDQSHGWLVFADPFTLDSETWLRGWGEAYRTARAFGGLASGVEGGTETQVYLGGQVHREGAVAISFGGQVRLEGLLSQACTPIGQAWTITKAEGNYIHRIGNQPAFQVLVDTFNGLSQDQQRRAGERLFVGLVADEYQEEFRRGDFLIRNLIGGDRDSGVLLVGARPRTGQSLQFQCTDAEAGTQDMVTLLARTRKRVGTASVYGGCLCSCNGRGRGLFGVRNHDATLAQRYLGPLALTGFFCNGEIGPVHNRSFVHGYSASLALFVAR